MTLLRALAVERPLSAACRVVSLEASIADF
ncbi:hypothetical protein LPU83_pLPU83d_1002 (plasmid) [Rhizobium favelukesii]|uniref:Uncharacterized protein n=1 Tax=Rhizobium favelukesii TaxID=348824 RepID=W6RMM5_9HYPH|nr:hypothetical protein LPU83_pLPU83d_1002 [Rhizobium favelukesii]